MRFRSILCASALLAAAMLPVSGLTDPAAAPCPEDDPVSTDWFQPEQIGAPKLPPPDADVMVHAGLGSRRPPDGTGEAPVQFMRYYPTNVQVHRCDVIRWDLGRGYNSWHDIAFFKEDMDVAKHPTFDPSAPYFPHVWRSDEVPGVAAYNEKWAFGYDPDAHPQRRVWENTGPLCGTGQGRTYNQGTMRYRPKHLQPCLLDSTHKDLVSSMFEVFLGMASDGYFRVLVDLPPGEYRYHSLMHPGVEGRIRVVANEVALDNPTGVQVDAEIKRDYENALALRAALNDRTGARADSTGWRRDASGAWIVHVGAATTGDAASRPAALADTAKYFELPDGGRQPVAQLFLHLPENLRVTRGDSVRWMAGFDDDQEFVDTFTAAHPDVPDVIGPPDVNTVTFPHAHPIVSGGFNCKPAACENQIPTGLAGAPGAPNCELDGPQDGLPGISGIWLGLKRCPPGTYFEAFTAPWYDNAHHAPGDLIATRATYHDSGLMWDAALPAWFRERPSDPQWYSDFRATFPVPDTFSYVCLAHAEFMQATVTTE